MTRRTLTDGSIKSLMFSDDLFNAVVLDCDGTLYPDQGRLYLDMLRQAVPGLAAHWQSILRARNPMRAGTDCALLLGLRRAEQEALYRMFLVRARLAIRPNAVLRRWFLDRYAAHTRVVIVSNGDAEWVRDVLRRLTVPEWAVADIIGLAGKPEWFARSVPDWLARLPPQRVLVVGDRPDLDTLPARQRGWQTVLIGCGDPNGQADAAARSIEEFCGWWRTSSDNSAAPTRAATRCA
jgi:FMN phosphatase YigB (HAD superfamily)